MDEAIVFHLVSIPTTPAANNFPKPHQVKEIEFQKLLPCLTQIVQEGKVETDQTSQWVVMQDDGLWMEAVELQGTRLGGRESKWRAVLAVWDWK
jgi:hypothetical protein